MFIWQCDQKCVFLSGLVTLVPGGQTVSLGSTVISSPDKSLFHLRVPFLAITEFLPLSFLARGNFHYRNLSLPMSVSEFKTLKPKRQHSGVSEFTELAQGSSYHLSQGKSFQISLGMKCFLHSLALSMMHVTLLPFGGQFTEVGESSPSFLVTQSIEFTILSLRPQRVVVMQNSMQNSLLFLIGTQKILNFELSRAVSFRNQNYLFVFKAMFIICTNSYSSV